MNTIATDLRSSIHQCDYITACLEQLEPNDKAHIPGPQHKYMISGFHSIEIH